MAFGGWNSGNFAPPDVTQPATTVSRCDQGRWPKRDFIKVRAARRDVRLKLKMDNYKLRNAYLTEIRHISRDLNTHYWNIVHIFFYTDVVKKKNG